MTPVRDFNVYCLTCEGLDDWADTIEEARAIAAEHRAHAGHVANVTRYICRPSPNGFTTDTTTGEAVS